MSSKKTVNKKGNAWPPVGPDDAEPIPVEIKKKRSVAKIRKKKAVDSKPKIQRRSKRSRKTEISMREVVVTKNHISKAGWVAAAFSWGFFVTFWLLGVIH